MPVRTTLRLGLACSNRCVFCPQDGLTDRAAPPLEQLRASADELTFTGGEPLLRADLVEQVAAARAAGFARIGVQTNGHGLATRAEELEGAGLTDVHVTVLAADPVAHDYHTGTAGSFAELEAGLAAARAHGLLLVAATVVTRSSFRGLSALPLWLRDRGVSAWLLEVPRTAGRAASGFDRVVPRLGMAVPFALHALDTALKLGLPAWIRGAPLCALGPFAARALPDLPRAFAPACDGCDARPSCGGVEAVYLARYGDGELRPRAPVTGDAAELARLFVGAGEVHVPEAGRVEPSPAAVREALPQLGKVKPAAGEVVPGEPKKSGEQLREILPQLFEPR